MTWQLTGNTGYRYVIEKSSGDAQWNPFLVVTNLAGKVTYTDPGANSVGINFYRARILE